MSDEDLNFYEWRAKKQRQRAQANKGKSSEAETKRYCERLVAKFGVRCLWERPVDARQAGGMLKAATGDFNLILDGRLAIIEVKETALTDRLPRANFKKDQIARLQRRAFAGCVVVVLIHHTTTDVWRCESVTKFWDQTEGAWLLNGALSGNIDAVLDSALHKLFNP